MRNVDIDLSNDGLGAKARPATRSTAQQSLRDIPQPTHPLREELGLLQWMLYLVSLVGLVGGFAFWLVGSATALWTISGLGVLMMAGGALLFIVLVLAGPR